MIARVHTHRLEELLGTFPVVAVIGARQVGKSTLVRQGDLQTGRRYVTLDDFDSLGLAEKDPRALLTGWDAVTVDEVQRCPSLLRAIKTEVDRDRCPGRFLITGSADLNLTANLSQELAGRVGVLSLPPLMWRELEGCLARPRWLDWIDCRNIQEIDPGILPTTPKYTDTEAILLGGYPLSVTASSPHSRRDWFAAYRFTYLERDVRQISNIGNLADFARLFQMLASRSSQLLNIASVARDVGLKTTTAGRYLSVLEASFQILRLEPWFANFGKRLVKSPKLYWSDTGLLGHLLGVEDWTDVAAHSFDGPMLETFAMMEIKKQVDVYEPGMRLHFLRSHDGMEIDGVLLKGIRQLPFEIKASSTIRIEDAAPLEKYLSLVDGAYLGLVFYRGTECRPLSRRVLAVPLAALCC